MFDFLAGLFSHKYDIRAIVELENGDIYKIKVLIEAFNVSQDEMVRAIKREAKWQLNSPVKRIIEMYDASNPSD